MSGLFSLINLARGLPWKLIGILAIVASAFVGGCRHGAKSVTAKWDTERAESEIKLQQLAAKQAQTTTQVVTQYVDRVKVVKQRGADIVKEVNVYVPVQADVACTVPRGFVRLHDAAAEGVVPDAPNLADAAPSGVALSTTAATVADNYGRYHEVAEQLKSLQQWVREQQALTDGGTQ